MTAYDWALQSPPAVPDSLPPVHRAAPGGLEGALVDGVDWVLRAVGLLDVLDEVTGDADALHAAANRWLAQATAVRAMSVRLRQGAVAVGAGWDGEASAAFGAFMGTCVAAVDGLTADLAETARILNQAGAAAGIAEDLVTGIVADAAEVAAAELAATLAADLLTFGLASFAGALAESATLAVFVERAVQASAALGRTLELLAQELRELKKARDAIHAAGGFAKLRELKYAQSAIGDLELLGTAYRVLNAATDTALGLATGLPLGADGARRFSAVVGRTLGEEEDVVKSVF
jgi:uncharacterized protein YukE